MSSENPHFDPGARGYVRAYACTYVRTYIGIGIGFGIGIRIDIGIGNVASASASALALAFALALALPLFFSFPTNSLAAGFYC